VKPGQKRKGDDRSRKGENKQGMKNRRKEEK
jgi:hypothetical protein